MLPLARSQLLTEDRLSTCNAVVRSRDVMIDAQCGRMAG